MNFVWNNPNYTTGNLILAGVIMALFFIALYFLYSRVVKRKVAYIYLSISVAIIILGFIFDVWPVFAVGLAFLVICTTISLFVNLGDLRKFISSPFKVSTVKPANFKVEKIFDRSSTYKIINESVVALSKKRTGAIITFERNTSLKDVIKNGVPVNAPVSAELLDTIFYPGTRLHDGAVIIHNNEIIAASVFFTPTTKPFAGKYGSRHRAALGISEISDSVTVVVSEETGRISIAVNGQLTTADQNSFLRMFESFMDGHQ